MIECAPVMIATGLEAHIVLLLISWRTTQPRRPSSSALYVQHDHQNNIIYCPIRQQCFVFFSLVCH